MADIKISELEPTTELEGLYTIGSDKNNLSKKVSLQFLKDAANYATEQGDYAKREGDTIESRIADFKDETNSKLTELSTKSNIIISLLGDSKIDYRGNSVYIDKYLILYNDGKTTGKAVTLNTTFTLEPTYLLVFDTTKEEIIVRSAQARVLPTDIVLLNYNSRGWETTTMFTANLLAAGLESIKSYLNVKGSIKVLPGVLSGNGNLWSLQDSSKIDSANKWYWRALSTYNFIKIKSGDTLTINYTQMGVDNTIYKIGVAKYNDDLVSKAAIGDNESEVVWYTSNTSVKFVEDCYIRITISQLDASAVLSHKSEKIVPIVFESYHSADIELCKEPATSSPNGATFPYAKAITYPIVKPLSAYDVAASSNYVGQQEVGYNQGYVIFPNSYEARGEKMPLILFLHGTDGFKFTTPNNPTYLSYLKEVAKGGYIVADCSSLSSFYYNNDNGVSKTIIDANYAEPIAWECYHKFYQHLVERYNIDENRVYVFGKSAGGMNTIMLSQMGVIPIKAAAGLAGSIDLITNMRIMYYQDTNTNPFLHRIGLTDANVGSELSGEGDAEYLVENQSKLIGLNPFWWHTHGLDRSMQIRRCVADGMSSSAIEADKDLQDAIAAASTDLRIPIKWWQAVDDVNVPIATTRMYQKMVRNGGGYFAIREIPSGYGAHHAVDNDSKAPTTSYIHKNGVVVTLPTAYAEVLDWFQMWW